MFRSWCDCAVCEPAACTVFILAVAVGRLMKMGTLGDVTTGRG